MANGYVYIMTNPALQGMVKIGYATDVEVRRRQLFTTSIPCEFDVYATYETDINLEDKKLHKLIDEIRPELRVTQNREFYYMTPEEAYRLLYNLADFHGVASKVKMWDCEDVDDVEDDFKPSRSWSDWNLIPNGIYTLKRTYHKNPLEAKVKVTDGEWVLLEGSKIATTKGSGTSGVVDTFRYNLTGFDAEGYVLEDISLGTCAPSFAASVVAWGDIGGWGTWKTEDGQFIDIFRQ